MHLFPFFLLLLPFLYGEKLEAHYSACVFVYIYLPQCCCTQLQAYGFNPSPIISQQLKLQQANCAGLTTYRSVSFPLFLSLSLCVPMSLSLCPCLFSLTLSLSLCPCPSLRNGERNEYGGQRIKMTRRIYWNSETHTLIILRCPGQRLFVIHFGV